MKKILFSISTLVLLLFSSCSDENKIRKTAFGYLDAMGNYRISEAYPYATKETREGTLKFIENTIMPNTDSCYIKSETPAKITITNVSITSDSTASVMFHKSTPSSEKNSILNLVKRDGKWQADVRIEVPSIMKSSGNGNKGQITFDTTKYNKLKLREVSLDTINSSPRL